MNFKGRNTLKLENFLGLDGKTIKSSQMLVFPGSSPLFPIALISLEDKTKHYFQHIDEEKLNNKLYELKAQFHKLWSKDMDTKNYDKEEWQYFASILSDFGLHVS